MRVFLDTNVILDAIVRRDAPGLTENATLILSLGETKVVDLYMSVLSIPTVAYVLKNMTASAKRGIIRDLTSFINVLPSLPGHVSSVLEGSLPDIEDALQVQSALEGSCDLIVTRNGKDFAASSIPVISPEDFLSRVVT